MIKIIELPNVGKVDLNSICLISNLKGPQHNIYFEVFLKGNSNGFRVQSNIEHCVGGHSENDYASKEEDDQRRIKTESLRAEIISAWEKLEICQKKMKTT